ncbi:MAG: sulfatase-like hydrolase/transferase, partial [Planctomycetota bacterium]
MTAPRPNVVYIITDQQRADHIGCHTDAPLRTPNLDRLAADGISFRRFYCNNPICTPSRAAILTGRTPRSNRVWDNGCPLPETETTLPAVLREHGYATHAVGKLHLTPWWDRSATYYESTSYWREAKHDDAPEPYAGFEAAELCLGHIDPTVGHYGRWLRREHPDVAAHWKDYLSPHPSGAPGAQVWTLPPACHANAWIADRACAFLDRAAE